MSKRKKLTIAQALAALRAALDTGILVYRNHAYDQIDAAGLLVAEVTEDIAHGAAAGAVSVNRSEPNRFVVHGVRIMASFEVYKQPDGVEVITIMIIEW